MSNSSMKVLGITAGCLGLVQAVSYFIMVILCILCYENVLSSPTNDVSLVIIYRNFLQYNSVAGSPLIVSGEMFFIFMCCYLALYIMWIISSSLVLKYSMDSKFTQLKNPMLTWALLAIVISILDAALAGLVGHDLAEYLKVSTSLNPLLTNIIEAYITVMSVASKGYVMWFVNLIIGLLLITRLKRLRNSPNPNNINRPIIYGYDTQQATTPYNAGGNPWFSNPTSPPPSSYYDTTNRAFDGGDEDNQNRARGFERSHSFQPVAVPQNNPPRQPQWNNGYYNTGGNNNPQKMTDNYNPGRLATIAKPGRRSPPNQMPKLNPVNGPYIPPNGPYIPEPDYSPPGTPTLKSSLKPRPLY